MSNVVTLEDFEPVARFDSIPWAQAVIEEGPTAGGTWTVIDTLTITPADLDPSQPADRSFTTSNATAPDGLWYRITFVDGAGGTSAPTAAIQNQTSTTGDLYVSRDELKSSLSATGTSFLDDDIDDAIEAASAAINEACGRQTFGQASQTRVYTVGRSSGTIWLPQMWSPVNDIDIDDLVSVTTLTVDTDGDGVYETTWAENTDFYLDPPNAAADGWPFERVVLIRNQGRRFPTYDNAIQIAGIFGWPAVPPEVRQYCKLFATQLLLRARQAPFGVISAGVEIGSTTRISKYDPDFDRMLGNLVKPFRIIA